MSEFSPSKSLAYGKAMTKQAPSNKPSSKDLKPFKFIQNNLYPPQGRFKGNNKISERNSRQSTIGYNSSKEDEEQCGPDKVKHQKFTRTRNELEVLIDKSVDALNETDVIEKLIEDKMEEMQP